MNCRCVETSEIQHFYTHSRSWTTPASVRNLAECTMFCYANNTCQTPVYQEFNKCLLIGDRMENLDLSSDGDSSFIDFGNCFLQRWMTWRNVFCMLQKHSMQSPASTVYIFLGPFGVCVGGSFQTAFWKNVGMSQLILKTSKFLQEFFRICRNHVHLSILDQLYIKPVTSEPV